MNENDPSEIAFILIPKNKTDFFSCKGKIKPFVMQYYDNVAVCFKNEINF